MQAYSAQLGFENGPLALLSEAEGVISDCDDANAADAAMLSAAQAVEHYEFDVRDS